MKNQASPKKTILLVDDIDESRIVAKWFLNSFDYDVESARSAEEALAHFNPAVHDLVLTDNSMPGMKGADMARLIKAQSPRTPILMFTGRAPENLAGIDQVITKPRHLLYVKDAIDKLLSPQDTTT